MTLLIDIAYWKLWHTLELLHHRCFNLFGELQMQVIFWWWDPRAHLHLSKRLEVFDRVALLPLYYLLYMYPFLKGDYFVDVRMLASLWAHTGFLQSAMLTIFLYFAIHTRKLYLCLPNYNSHWHFLAWPLRLPSAIFYTYIKVLHQRVSLTMLFLLNRFHLFAYLVYMWRTRGPFLGFVKKFLILFGLFGRDYAIWGYVATHKLLLKACRFT
jgi:hypothetical protein